MTATTCTRYSVNHFADACRECGEEWPCRKTLIAENASLRTALTDLLENRCVQYIPGHASEEIVRRARTAIAENGSRPMCNDGDCPEWEFPHDPHENGRSEP